MKVYNEVQNTTSRSTFNRANKMYLERKGLIHCSRCMYHDNENATTKYYRLVEVEDESDHYKSKFPNWKLVSKNDKQWFPKPIKFKAIKGRLSKLEYYEIKF